MKRFWTALIAIALLAGVLAFAGCGDDSGDGFELHFKNAMEVRIDNVYITPPENEYWGDPITIAPVQKGHTIGFDFKKFDGVSGNIYDIGLIDENAMDYDLYEVVLTTGDTMEMTGNADAAKLTVTHADGTKTEYEAIIYPDES